MNCTEKDPEQRAPKKHKGRKSPKKQMVGHTKTHQKQKVKHPSKTTKNPPGVESSSFFLELFTRVETSQKPEVKSSQKTQIVNDSEKQTLKHSSTVVL